MEWLPLGWDKLTVGSLVVLGGLFILIGRLIPKSWHDSRVSDKEAQIQEKNDRIAFLEAALEKRDEQLSQQIANNTVAVNALEAIRREAARTWQ